MTTFCSVGVGKQINQLFKNKILSKRKEPFKIHVIRAGGDTEKDIDYVPAVGGVHLGADTDEDQCEIEVDYLNINDKLLTYPLEMGIFNLIKRFLNSFGISHCRQTTLKDFHWKRIDDRKEINKHLCVGNNLESIRKIVAYIIDIFTLFLFNGRSFKSYYRSMSK